MLIAVSPKRIGWEPYLHLFWLGFMVLQPIADEDFTRRGWLFTFLLIAAFLPLYFWSFNQRSRAALPGFAGLVLLGMVGMPINSGSCVFFIYAAGGTAHRVKPRQAMFAILLILACVALAFAISPIPLPSRLWAFFPAAVFVPVMGGLNIFEAERNRNRQKLRVAHDEIEYLATIAERERIARDLHDLLGHTLSVITLKSELAGRLLSKDMSQAQQEISEVERISRDALAEVRAAVSGYRTKGFQETLTNAKLTLEPAGISFSFKGDTAVLTPLQESTLSLVLREAVTNILRHADATRCSVELTQHKKQATLEIADNGKGMRGAAMGNGLSGIRERIAHLGGELKVDSLQGTRLEITLPLEGLKESPHSKPVAAL